MKSQFVRFIFWLNLYCDKVVQMFNFNIHDYKTNK